MSYNRLIKKQVDKAFQSIGDLAVDVTLIEKSASSFSFKTGSAETSKAVTKVVKGILLNLKSPDKITNAVKAGLLLKSEDIQEPEIYDKAQIEGQLWDVVMPWTNNGYTVTLNLVRVT